MNRIEWTRGLWSRKWVLLFHLLLWALLIRWALTIRIGEGITLAPQSLHRDMRWVGIVLNMLVFYASYAWLLPVLLRRSRWLCAGAALLVLCLSVGIGVGLDALHLVRAEFEFEPHTLAYLVWLNSAPRTFYLLLGAAVRFAQDWFDHEQQNAEIRQQRTEAELAFLKSQIQPHFLFNTLNALYSSAYRGGDDRTAEGIGKLSQLLRYVLYEAKADRVSLGREVEYLRDYIALQQFRYGDAIDVRFDIDGDLDSVRIAPTLLITPVENAFKHGIIGGTSTIRLSLRVTRDALQFSIVNDCCPTRSSPDVEDGGLGLDNLRKQLAIQYADAHRLETEQGDGTFTLRLELQCR
jgi:two-component system, LytTR family, sensor kinase